jgi:hypothetical protein
MTTPDRQPQPDCIHYALCCSAQIQNASGCLGKKDCKFYAVHTSAPAPTLTMDEHMNKYPDQWYIGGQPKPDTEAERLFTTHTSAQAPDTSITELSAINAALLKLYPDDFALHLNAKQLMQVQKKHDAQVAKAERERENQRVLDSMKQFVDSGYYTGFAASQTERILWKIESLRAQQEPQQEGRR